MAATVEEVLYQLGIKTAGIGDNEIGAHCPFHADHHPSFSINIKSGLWICYQCGEAGTLEMLLQLVSGHKGNPTKILREVRHRAVTKKHEAVVEEPPLEELEPFVLYARYEGLTQPPQWAREQKKFTMAVSDRFGVKWDHGWVIPIWAPEVKDELSDLWGWQFKRMDHVSNYPPQVKKSKTLFGLRELEGTTVVVVESPLDVCRLAAVGVPAVATYGAFVSKEQIKLLIEHAERIVLALDNDVEGMKQAHKIYPRLARQIPTMRAAYDAKDPGDLSDRAARRAFESLMR